MVQMYTIAGAKIGSHWLAIATLGTVFGGSWYATRGPKKAGKDNSPPINATSKEEEAFIQEFLKNAEAEDKSGAKH